MRRQTGLVRFNLRGSDAVVGQAAARLRRLFHAPLLDLPVQRLERVDNLVVNVGLAADGIKMVSSLRPLQEALEQQQPSLAIPSW